jgi:ribosomal protein S18 acetylase RimI-like enzyme
MELVEATRTDVDVLAEFWFALASGMEQYSDLNELALEGPAEAREGFERQLDREDTTVFLIQAEGTSVGFLTLREGTRPSREWSAYATIVDLFVEAEHRGQGLGSDAIEAVTEIASDRGCAYVTVSCEWDNDDARRFYEGNGFEAKQVTYAQRLDSDS